MSIDLELDRPVASGIPKVDVPTCPVCGSASRHLLYAVREHEYSNTTDDEFALKECDDCSAWYLDPRPDKTALEVIYPPNYYAYVQQAQLDASSGKTVQRGPFKRIALALYRIRVKPVMRHVQPGPATTWFDVGCGSGYAMEALRDAYGLTCSGLDMSATAVAHCRRRGFEAHVSRFEDYRPREGERYDVVHSSHVIEHVESPRAYMEQCRELLKPGGLCVFITPNTATPEARRFGRHWGGLHVPRHWTMLNPRSARRLADLTGFQHVATSFSTNGTFWIWSLHSSLRGRLADRWNDRLFPSDHRAVETNAWNFLTAAGFAFLDMAMAFFTRQSANMLCIFRKSGS
jgi:2-polyprenyl-3-methyl-5-hydroxy-6-metoxy-1,4-benzoquinol methylase